MKFDGEIPSLDTPKKVAIQNGIWAFPEQMGVSGCCGFIYIIRDTILNRFYLGKKSYLGAGVKNKGKESDWKKYRSSSKLLKEVMAYRPPEEFEYICVEEYTAKGALSYAETWTLCLVEAPTSVTWYNTRIEKVSWSVKEGITDRHKERLARARSLKPMGD